jgi:hypothetical protein
MNSIAICKQRLPLPELLVRLNLFERPPKPGNYRCPLHQERNGAAFDIAQKRGTWLWNCHGKCSTGGDEITLLQSYFNLTRSAAIRRYEEFCEIRPERPLANLASPYRRVQPLQFLPQPSMPIELPSDLHKGNYDSCAAVAKLRNVPVETILAMNKAGHIAFAQIHGCDAFVLMDDTHFLAEARRMNGELFPAYGPLAARKTHTLKGSRKNWPLGLSEGSGPILLVEGSGDFIAAHHFCSFTQRSHTPWTPVALLGAGIKNLHPDSLELFEGRKVRIVPHMDTAGRKAATSWANMLIRLGCNVDGFDLSALTKSDGTPVKDLNDATSLIPSQSADLNDLFRMD